MAQIFPRWTNLLHFVAGAGAAFAVLSGVGFFWYYGSPKYTDVGYRPKQPVPYSHRLHAGQMGMDCRYCHVNVERAAVASVPPTQVCMNCHTTVLPQSEKLTLLRDTFAAGKPLEWVRVHKIPDYAYFDHAAHLRAGVGCASCHGRVDQMEEVQLVQPLSMGWCLECHRNPDPHLRDTSSVSVTQMDWVPPANQLEIAAKLKQEKNIQPPEDCSACHR